ncbi:MAG: hypothetical protein AAFW98_06715, partial [Pseudomonadota bacterium]
KQSGQSPRYSREHSVAYASKDSEGEETMRAQMANEAFCLTDLPLDASNSEASHAHYASQLHVLRSALDLHAALVADTVDFFGDEAPMAQLEASRARVQEIYSTVELANDDDTNPIDDVDHALQAMMAELRRLSGHEVVMQVPAEGLGVPFLDLGQPVRPH